PGVLTHSHHADDEWWEQPQVTECLAHALTRVDLLASTLETVGDDTVPNDLFTGLDGVQDRDSGLIHQSKEIGEAREDDLLQDSSRDWQPQLDVVEVVLTFGVGLNEVSDPSHRDDRGHEHDVPVIDSKVGDADQDPRL